MSKDLEKEYKQNIEDEIPDLWARIEKNLPEKVQVDKESPKEQPENNISLVYTNPNVKKERKTKKFNAKTITLLSGVLVACLAGLIILPSVINGTLKNNSDMVSARQESKDDRKSNAVKSSDSARMLVSSESKKEETMATAECEEASDGEYTYDGYATDDIETAGATASDDLNSAKENATEAKEDATFYFIRQYGNDGVLNFDKSGKLLRDIDEIESSGSICIRKSDIKEAKLDKDVTGGYVVDITFTEPAKDAWYEITDEASKNDEVIAIYFKGKVICTPKVICAIPDGATQINGLTSEEANEIINVINSLS